MGSPRAPITTRSWSWRCVSRFCLSRFYPNFTRTRGRRLVMESIRRPNHLHPNILPPTVQMGGLTRMARPEGPAAGKSPRVSRVRFSRHRVGDQRRGVSVVATNRHSALFQLSASPLSICKCIICSNCRPTSQEKLCCSKHKIKNPATLD